MAVGFGLLVVLFMFLFLLEPLPVHAGTSIGVDSPVAIQTCTSCGSTLSWQHMVGSNSNRVLIVAVSVLCNSGCSSTFVSSVTFGPSSTLLTALTPEISGINLLAQQWYLLNPSSGLGTVTVTFSAGLGAAVGASVSFFNVAGIGASNGVAGSGSPASVSISSANPGDLLVDTLASGVSSSPVAGQTQLWNQFPANILTGAGSDKTAASPVLMQWTLAGFWALVAVDLQASAPPIPEYPLGLPILAIFMIIGYGVIRRKVKHEP